MADPGMLQILYQSYRVNGGKLDYQAWLNAGQPTGDKPTSGVHPGSPTPGQPSKTYPPGTTFTVPGWTPPATPKNPSVPWVGQPYETEWLDWFKTNYPSFNIDTISNIAEIRAWWEKNKLPKIIKDDIGGDDDDAAAAAVRIAEARLKLDIDIENERRRRQNYLDQVEQARQEAEARNKAWSLAAESRRQESESAIEKQRNELELIKGRSFPFPYEEGNRMAWQDMQRTAFENARQSILGSLSSPADWIKKWEVQNAANPYTPQPQSQLEQSQGESTNAQTRVNMFTQMADEAQKLVDTLSNDPSYAAGTSILPGASYDTGNDPGEGDLSGTEPDALIANLEASVLTQARNDVINYRNAAEAERGRLSNFQTDVNYLRGQPQPAPSQPARRGNAPAPGWLPLFAPGQRAGQPITRENVATPSAQQWTATPWSVQQGLSGYLDWAGYRPLADVLGNMAQMLPNAPGGGARWSPYIGR